MPSDWDGRFDNFVMLRRCEQDVYLVMDREVVTTCRLVGSSLKVKGNPRIDLMRPSRLQQ